MSKPGLLRLTSIGGVLGALTMLAGDLLLYAHWGETNASTFVLESVPFRASIVLASENQLGSSAILGAIATAFYLLGAWHIGLLFEPPWRRAGLAASLMFGFAAIVGGVYHAFWSAYGMVLQVAAEGPEVERLAETVKRLMETTNSFAAVPLLLSSLVLLVAVLLAKTTLPRWSALLTPLPLTLLTGALLTPIAEAASSPYNALIKGTSFNLVMLVFFSQSALLALLVRRD